MTTDEHFELLKTAPLNSWIAFSEDETRIVAVGRTYSKVVEKSEAAGEHEPVLFKTPPVWGPMFFPI